VTPAGRDATRRRAERLRRSQDFVTVMRSGRRSRHRLLHIAVRGNGLPQSRFGFSVGKRVGKAVVRNRVKRRLRAIMRELRVRAGYDIVTIAQESAVQASFGELRTALTDCLGRAGALEREDA
jgi:ribonuclease P protein component